MTSVVIPGRVEVLIAGGGPAGLAAALELGSRGVEVVVLEPRAEVSLDRPRAKTTSVRTMEHLRRWGIAERLREVAPLPVAWSHDAVFATTVLGREITRFHDCFGLTAERCDAYAEAGQQVPQPLVEQVLREAVAREPSVTLATGYSLIGLVESDDAVSVEFAAEHSSSQRLSASYVLGCDGSGSATRRAIGAFYEGTADSRTNFNMVFRAPGLAERVPHGPAIHCWVLDPVVPGLVGRMDLADTWWAMAMAVDEATGNADPVGLARALIGDGADELEIEIMSTDPWTARMLNANTYGTRRVFLVGDAAHLNPPWGGHGFNTAVGDAVNIGWKLAAVVQGWGGTQLLGSYERERKPIAQQTIDLASRNMSQLSTNFADPLLSVSGPDGDAARADTATRIQAAKHEEFHSLGLVLGYNYGNSPIIVPDGTPEVDWEPSHYEPTARPGARLPHQWLPDGRSIFDALGRDLTLVRLDASVDSSTFVAAAMKLSVPLHVLDLPELGCVPSDTHQRYCGALLLVRPDQHVAWRTNTRSVDEALATRVLEQVTGRSR
jgi:2-polyprenyl-6-methoxyphenol hydroxylase-like FAD-dependent oxidoreductase